MRMIRSNRVVASFLDFSADGKHDNIFGLCLIYDGIMGCYAAWLSNVPAL